MNKGAGNTVKDWRTGFGMIEILIISVVIVIAVGGIAALMARSIRAKRQSANRVIATYLAEEGITLMEHVRDINVHNEGVQYDNHFQVEGVFTIDHIDESRAFDAVQNINIYSNNGSHMSNIPELAPCNLEDGTVDDPGIDKPCRLWTQKTGLSSGNYVFGPCMSGYFHKDGYTSWRFGDSQEQLCFSSTPYTVSFGTTAFEETPFYRMILVTNYDNELDCIQPHASDGIPGCKKIESIVAWKEYGDVKTEKVSTFFYDIAKREPEPAPPPLPQTLPFYIVNGNDGAEEKTYYLYKNPPEPIQYQFDSPELDFDAYQERYNGMIFRNVTIPPGSQIVNAKIVFTAETEETSENETNDGLDIKFWGYCNTNPPHFDPNAGGIQYVKDAVQRPRAPAGEVIWNNLDDWIGDQTRETPDYLLNPIIEDIIDGTCGVWSGNGAIGIGGYAVLGSSTIGGKDRDAWDLEHGSGAPVLYVTFIPQS